MIQPLQHRLIRTSAGTGKTHALTSRYLQLLRMGQEPDEILASTFTRKAAGEISRASSLAARSSGDRSGGADPTTNRIG